MLATGNVGCLEQTVWRMCWLRSGSPSMPVGLSNVCVGIRTTCLRFCIQPAFPSTTMRLSGAIRPAVILRKNSDGNRSQRGADCQLVRMSIFRNLKQRGHGPIRTLVEALATYITTKKLR